MPEPMPWAARFDMRDERVTLRIEEVAQQLPQTAKFHFFPLEWGVVSHAAPQHASFEKGALVLGLARGDFAGEKKPTSLDGVLAVETQAADGSVARHGYSFSAAPSETPIAGPAAISAIGGSSGGLSLIVALGFAFLGGLILNLMPCVFPVLSLKALSLAKDAGNAEARRAKGFVYLAGVLVSFALIALALVVLRGGGGAIGWGMQFQSPAFVLAMMALFLALALNLSGAFTLGGTVAGLGDSLTRRSGLSGYFFTGVLATVVATPCTAPFMGAAMGYAFTQPAPTVFAVLLALGFGFALPIVLLSLSPGLGRWLPKPGAWMETFKQLMAFPLYATVAWLLWVLTIQQGSDGVLAASVTLIGVAFAVWLFGRSPEAGQGRSVAAALIALLAIGAGIWSMPQGAADKPVVASNAQKQGGPKAEPFTQARLSELLGQNKPVFVNLTAAWCITCKVNERVALRSERNRESLQRPRHFLSCRRLDERQSGDYRAAQGTWPGGRAALSALFGQAGRSARDPAAAPDRVDCPRPAREPPLPGPHASKRRFLRMFVTRRTILAMGAALSAAAATAVAPAASAAPDIGKSAPAFTAIDTKGNEVTLADLRGKVVVLEWTNHQCPYVRKHYGAGNMQKLQAEAARDGVVWLTIISSHPGSQGHVSPAEADRLTASRDASPAHVILDEKGTIGRAYKARTTPHMVVIDRDGTLVFMGGIDDRPTADKADIEGATNYVRAALEAVKSGQPVETPIARPYGCSIKYAPEARS